MDHEVQRDTERDEIGNGWHYKASGELMGVAIHAARVNMSITVPRQHPTS